jgi:Zn-dependent protease
MLRGVFRLAFYMALIVISICANVYLHELGHFAVADAAGLSPSIHFMEYDNLSEVAFSAQNIPLAYVTYSVSASAIQDLIIALAGPLVNVLLAILIAVAYMYTPLKDRVSVQLAYFVLLIPTLIAIVSNFIPIAGTDGYLMLKAISSLL